MSNKLQRISFYLLGIFTLVLLFVRIFNNISFLEPLQLITSGWEEEALYTFWKFIHSKPIYEDPYKIPYVSSFFNWLFYYIYGYIIKLVMVVFSLKDDWIPTLGHVTTIFISSSLGILFYKFGRKLLSKKEDRLSLFAISTFVCLGPLMGFWSMTLRPDILALTVEFCAFLYFIRNFEKAPNKTSIVFSLLAYLAWSVKHNYVLVLVGVCLYLIFSKSFRQLIIVVLISWSLYGLTFYFGGEVYRHSILFSQKNLGFQIGVGVKNFSTYAIKSLPILSGFFAAVFLHLRGKNTVEKSLIIKVLVSILLFGYPFVLILASKYLSSDNYYFSIFLYTAVGFVYALSQYNDHKLFKAISTLGSLGTCVAILLILTGRIGNLSNRYIHNFNLQQQKCIAMLEKPLYTLTTYASLPWINPTEPHFLLSSIYLQDRALGYKFEKGGIDAIVATGYFKTLLYNPNLPNYRKLVDEEFPGECKGLEVYQRID
jgi:hypothetical protein